MHVGIPEIEIGFINLESLAVGEIYHGDELIIDKTDMVSVNMITLRRGPDSDGEITVNRYYIKYDKGKIASITYTEGQEFFPHYTPRLL